MPDDAAVLETATDTPALETPSDTTDTTTATPAAAEPAAPASEAIEPEPEPTPDQGIEWPLEDEGEPEAAATEAQPPAAAAAEPTEPATLTPAQRWGPPALTKLLTESPELAKVAEANPRLRSQLYQMARRSGELAEFQQVMPTIGAAREAAEAKGALAAFDESFYGNQPEEFLKRLYEAQLVTDQATGNKVSSGAYERMAQSLHGALFDHLSGLAETQGNGRLQEAVQTIREALGWAQPRHSRAQDRTDPELPLELRQQLDRGRQAEAQLQRLHLQSRQQEQTTRENWRNETAAEAARQITDFASGLLAKAAFTDYEKQAITRDFLESVVKLAESDPVQNAVIEELFSKGGMSPQTRQQMVQRTLSWVRQHVREAMEPHIKRATAARATAQAARDARRSQARREPASAGGAANVAVPNDREVAGALRTKLGRNPTDRELLNALMADAS